MPPSLFIDRRHGHPFDFFRVEQLS